MADNGVGPTTAPRPGRRRVQMLVAAAIGIAAVALVVVVATHSSSTSNGLTHANAAASPVVAPPVSVPPPTTVPTSTQPAALQAVPVDASTVAVAAPQNAVVTIATVAPCWIRVTDPTGATVLETTMAAGEQQTVPIGSGVEVRVGNASAAALTVNGGAVTTHHSGPDPYNVQFNVA